MREPYLDGGAIETVFMSQVMDEWKMRCCKQPFFGLHSKNTGKRKQGPSYFKKARIGTVKSTARANSTDATMKELHTLSG
jgi:hypothetical protein